MAASSKESLTQGRKLKEPSVPSGFCRPPGEDRAVCRAEVGLSWECFNCEKHIKKVKKSLVCGCKEAVFCSFDCQQSSNHKKRCKGTETRDTTVHDPSQCNCKAEKEANPSPFQEELDAFMMRAFRRSPEDVMAMAEAGDTMAAYHVGIAYAERKRCNIKGCGDNDDCPARGYSMPKQFLEKSIAETDEIAIKWLKVAAESGIPHAMYKLAKKMQENQGLVKDTRIAHYWLSKAYGTGKMDALKDILENGAWGGMIAGEFVTLHDVLATTDGNGVLSFCGPTMSHLLMATNWQNLINWGGKTGNGKPFYGRFYLNEIIKMLGKLEPLGEKAQSGAFSEKKKLILVFISGRPGINDAVTRSVVVKERSESNIKFLQGSKAVANPDFQLLIQTSVELPDVNATKGITYMRGRSNYLVNCKHHEVKVGEGEQMQGPPGSNLGKKGMSMGRRGNLDINDFKKYKGAGECKPCVDDAIQRLHAVAQGLYSISLTEAIPDYGYAARYVSNDGTISQDIFKSYSKPDITQVLQCLMSNPADLHPLAVADDANLYWPIVWFWGSVFYAIQDCCDETTLKTVYGGLGPKITILKSAPTSALATFPDTAAGEWRIACGSEQCSQLDHEVKFSVCKGCKVRRYCNEVCQRKDWAKHRKFCKAEKKNVSN